MIGWTELGVIVSIIGVAVALFFSIRTAKRESDLEAIVRRKVATLEVAGYTSVEEIKSSYRVRIPPVVNRGEMPAHDVNLKVVFPPGARIEKIDPGEFSVAEGGVDFNTVVFHTPVLYPGRYTIPPSIISTAVPTATELGYSEHTGVISIPFPRY